MNGTVGRASILLGHYTLPSSAPLPLLHIILRTKTDDIPTKSTSSSSSGGNKHSSQSHSSPSHSHSSHSQHTSSSSHSHSRGSGSHRGYSSSSTHHSSHHTSHSSQGHHDRMRERDRGHGRCASHPSTVLCVHSQYVHIVFFLVSRSSLSPSSLTNSCSSLHVEIVQPLFFPLQFLNKFSVFYSFLPFCLSPSLSSLRAELRLHSNFYSLFFYFRPLPLSCGQFHNNRLHCPVALSQE